MLAVNMSLFQSAGPVLSGPDPVEHVDQAQDAEWQHFVHESRVSIADDGTVFDTTVDPNVVIGSISKFRRAGQPMLQIHCKRHGCRHVVHEHAAPDTPVIERWFGQGLDTFSKVTHQSHWHRVVGPLAFGDLKQPRAVDINGRQFFDLCPLGVLNGLSLNCKHCGYARNLSYVSAGLSREEAVQRLLRWEERCTGNQRCRIQDIDLFIPEDSTTTDLITYNLYVVKSVVVELSMVVALLIEFSMNKTIPLSSIDAFCR